jgi:uncharacterized membrane protein YdbT with pleckstrin-like domain
MKNLEVAKYLRMIESLFEVILSLTGVLIVYISLSYFLNYFNLVDTADDMMASMLILPVLYILKDFYKVFDSLTVVAEYDDKTISVTRGILTKVKDTLEFKKADNIELVTTIAGGWFGYATIRLYSPGGSVEVPFIYNSSCLLDHINFFNQSNDHQP